VFIGKIVKQHKPAYCLVLVAILATKIGTIIVIESVKIMTNLVFVYGSLKSGFGNHRCLSGAIPMEEDARLHDATMLDLGAFPAVIPGANTVYGELYEVTPEILERLDRLEGHPTFYQRHKVTILCYKWTGEEYSASAWCYFLSKDSQAHYEVICEPVASGHWEQSR